jgi:hypothetical protein
VTALPNRSRNVMGIQKIIPVKEKRDKTDKRISAIIEAI